jgi:PAS domain S-box-containing protein
MTPLPDIDIREQELGTILDIPGIQELMNEFYQITQVGMAILDLKGNVLVATGWQDICVNFHRRHPQTLKNCIESDLFLTRNVKAVEYLIYKCKNNMWDIITPISLDGIHIANLFLGQFFFEDEVPDQTIFLSQAEHYGFDKQAYLDALQKVPRWSREKVNHVMAFYTRFADLVGRLSYSKIKMRKTMEELHISRAFQDTFINTIPVPIFYKDVSGSYRVVNKTFLDFMGMEVGQVLGKTVYDLPIDKELVDCCHKTDLEVMQGCSPQVYESKMKHADGSLHDVIFYKSAFTGTDGSVGGIIGTMLDIT